MEVSDIKCKTCRKIVCLSKDILYHEIEAKNRILPRYQKDIDVNVRNSNQRNGNQNVHQYS